MSILKEVEAMLLSVETREDIGPIYDYLEGLGAEHGPYPREEETIHVSFMLNQVIGQGKVPQKVRNLCVRVAFELQGKEPPGRYID